MTETDTTQRPALVTGAADRIGATLARRLARAGHPVVIHYRNSVSDAEALRAAIDTEGGRAALVKADLLDRTQRSALIERAAEPFGPLAILVNNASIYESDSVETLDEGLWDAHFGIHAEAPLFLARDFAAQLPEETRGNIVNIIDERVWHLSPAHTSYTLSKTVLWSATQTMAQSLAPRIRVNAVGPGPTLPDADQTEDSFKRRISGLPLGNGATPDDVADALLYLINARAVTGQMLALDGGSHLEWPAHRAPTPRQS